MAYNTKAIKKDVDGKPIPQVFNPTLDEYEALKGDAGAARHVIYGPDGNPISTTGNKLAVRATEIETTLTQILAKIIATPATEAKQDSVITALGTLLTKTGFDAKADLALSALRDALRGTGNKTLTDLATALVPLATSAKQAEAIAALGAIANAAVTDPAANGTAIALLKGLLSRIQTLENKIDSITDGTTPATVQLSGSKMEVYGTSLDDRPDATTVPIGATFTIVDASQEFRSWISNGTNWGEEI